MPKAAVGYVPPHCFAYQKKSRSTKDTHVSVFPWAFAALRRYWEESGRKTEIADKFKVLQPEILRPLRQRVRTDIKRVAKI
jgi:hypothetical protein